MRLADELGIEDYLCPAGGCLLNDPEFSARFRDTGDDLRVTGSIDNSYQLDLTEHLRRREADEKGSEREPQDPFPTAFLQFDASGDYLWEEEEPDFDLTLSGRLDVSLSQLWGASLSTS